VGILTSMAPFDGSVASCGYLEAREGSRVSECESHALMPEASEASEGSWFAVTQSRSPQATGGRRYVSLCREVPVRAEGLFEGTTFLYVNGASEDELRGEEDVLETLSKRKSSFTLKGRFERRVSIHNVWDRGLAEGRKFCCLVLVLVRYRFGVGLP